MAAGLVLSVLVASAGWSGANGRTDPGMHPVGVVPSMTVPGELPLEEGRITCRTCHVSGEAPSGGALRLPAERLCQACHRT